MTKELEKVKDMDSKWKIKYPSRNIYIMRNHNWAFSAWEIAKIEKEINPGAKLLHIDFHDDYLDSQYKFQEIKTVSEAVRIGNELSICNFIKPAMQTGTIEKVYMIGDYEVRNTEEYMHSYTYNQFEAEHRRDFFQAGDNQSFILDLDLDFFNLHAHDFVSSYDSNPHLFSEEYIKRHLERLKQYDDECAWNIITVCISPEHCGGYKEAQTLLDLFIHSFDLENEEYIFW